MKPNTVPDQDMLPSVPKRLDSVNMFRQGSHVRRRDSFANDGNTSRLIGPILNVVAIENQTGSHGSSVRKGGLIRLSDGSVEVPENLVEVAHKQ